jgi:hypothetical protein
MSWFEATAIELVLFGLLWAGWRYCTRHLRAFFDLRLRVRRQILIMTAAGLAGEASAGELVTANLPLLAAPGETCRELGYEMLLFAERAPLSARLAKFMLFDPVRAGDDLVSLAYDGRFASRRKSIATALRFADDPPEFSSEEFRSGGRPDGLERGSETYELAEARDRPPSRWDDEPKRSDPL